MSIILEAVCYQSLWIWHAFFGLPDGNNDLNVLDRISLVRKLVEGNANSVGLWVNGTGLKSTTCSPMAFILSRVASSNPYKTPRTKKEVIF